MSEYEGGSDRHDPTARRWALARLVLGGAQMIGASIGAVLLAVAGLTPWSLGVALATTLLTTASVFLFGARTR